MKTGLRFLPVCVLALMMNPCLYAGEEAPISRHQCNDLKGNKLWEASVTIVALKDKGEDTYLLTEEGKGTYSGYKGYTVHRSTLEFISNKERIIPVKLTSKVFSEDGKLIAEETHDYDPKNNKVDCGVKDLTKDKDEKKTFKYKGDIVNSLLLSLYTRNFLEKGEKQTTVNLVSDEPALYSVTLRIEGREEIRVNGAAHKAYKVCIDPNLGLLSPAKAFLPKNYSWYSVEPPYDWLMFRGLESSIDSPKVEIVTLDK